MELEPTRDYQITYTEQTSYRQLAMVQATDALSARAKFKEEMPYAVIVECRRANKAESKKHNKVQGIFRRA